MTDNNTQGQDVVIEMANLTLSNDVSKRQDAAFATSTDRVKNEQDLSFDQVMLYRAIADTGRWAYGTISVEAWVLDASTGKLVRPTKAFWFDEAFVAATGKDNQAVMRLVDTTREDFVEPDPLAPGVGLAGALWSELSHHNTYMNKLGRSTFHRQTASTLPSTASSSKRTIDTTHSELISRAVVWRDVAAIANDPDQPYNLRLQVAVEAGIGLAAGVQFSFRGTQGLVVYMTRKNCDISKLKSATNEKYLLHAADVIGSIVSLRGPRHKCLAERRTEKEELFRRVRKKMIAVIRTAGGLCAENKLSPQTTAACDFSNAQPKQMMWGCCSFVKSKCIQVLTKCRGANNEPPPPMSTSESVWTFVGVFVTLLMLLSFSDAINKANPELSLVTGPFGALMTLQYGLTAAPASQPRNAIIGQTISLAIALGMTCTSLPTNLLRSLGTALSIMIMARLGCTHPPAGAAALIFTGGGYHWGHMGIMLLGNLLAILFATIINDLNVKRQYPTFWGFGYWLKHFGSEKKKVN